MTSKRRKTPVARRTLGGVDVEYLEVFDLRLFMEDELGCVPDLPSSDADFLNELSDEFGVSAEDSGENIGRIMLKLHQTPIKNWPYRCQKA